MSNQKVLVTGPIQSLSSYFTKLATLQSKHSFDVVLAQDLFSNIQQDDQDLDKLLSGEITVPVQVYAAWGKGKLPQKVQDKFDKQEEITTNLSLLPKAGLLSLASGLRIATLSGDSDSLTTSDITSLLSSFQPTASSSGPSSSVPPIPAKPADIFLSHLVPSSLTLISSKPLTPPSTRSLEEVFSPKVDEAAKMVRSKYHFMSSVAKFWEREPFEWPIEDGSKVGEAKSYCRALTLGEMGNKEKERWFYAFSITPNQPTTAPPSSTKSPFHPARLSDLVQSTQTSNGPRGVKRPAGGNAEDLNEMGVPNYIFSGQNGRNGGGEGGNKKGKGGPPPDHYTCRICDQKGHWIQECPEKETRDAERAAQRENRNGPREAIKPISPDECWFCLSNPKVTKHLIASIGSETYLTLPKGQVCSTDQSPVPGGGHVLLIPIAHYPTLRSIPSEVSAQVLEEIELYKQALKKCFEKFGADMVVFEMARTSRKGGHAHIQICPIPSSLSSEAESTFQVQAQKYGFELSELTDPSSFYRDAETDGQGTDYFKVDLPNGKKLVHWIKKDERFGFQFGRETVALLLHTPDRADWKQCAKSDEEEKKDCQRFKAAFKTFDPSS
ncbi:Drn1p [Sporobolomyces salmoneus]|uniref:Drn1p n=1 Tax=Sporobolomyces salmoneus TaxID=183962 RepID=UPI00317D43C3